MTRIYLGIGSNIDREASLRAGLDALRALLGPLDLSPVYDSPAMGFSGDAFLNMVAGADTDLPLAQLATSLRDIETRHGRAANARRFSPRRLDIDILTYGNLAGLVDGVELPRGEILEHAFVLRPLAELAPEARHPVSGQTYSEIWASFDQSSQPLRRVKLTWRSEVL